MLKKISTFQCGVMVLQIFSFVNPGAGLPSGLKASIAFDPSIDNVETNDLCLTSVCNQTALEILDNMNPEIQPCDNFYNFACGNFIKKKSIPNDKTQIHSFAILRKEIKKQIKTAIEIPITSEEPKIFKIIKTFYKSCMNTSAIEKAGLEPIIKIMDSIGGWPVVATNNWNENKFSVLNASVQLFEFGIDLDFKNSTKKIIVLDQPTLGLPRKYLLQNFDDKIIKAYYDYMVDIAVLFGANLDTAKHDLMKVLILEKEIARISLPEEEKRNMTLKYNPMTIKNFTKLYPAIPLRHCLQIYFPASVIIDDDDEEVINVAAPKYFEELNNLIGNITRKTMSNYVNWIFVRSKVEYLNEKVRNRQLEFHKILSGVTEKESRTDECISIITHRFSLILSALYVQNYFTDEAKKNAVKIVADIREQFDKLIEKVDWMDDETKLNALEKSKLMASYVAYSDELRDNLKIGKFYENFELMDNNFLNNIFITASFHYKHSLETFKEPFIKNDWKNRVNPAIVNAFYSPSGNYIEIPAGILQGVFFNNERPKYMNYGAIGFVIGHEVTHGFDDIGRQYDKNGNVIDWWKSSTKAQFLKKAQCIINHYGNYTVKEVQQNLNGIITQGENIADIGGIKGAYFAYLNWIEKNGQEPRLNGLEKYSPRQMFWISAANSWCSKIRPEALKNQVMNNPHSPAEYRIIGPLSNIPEFSNDFSCPVNSPMSAKNKCSVW